MVGAAIEEMEEEPEWFVEASKAGERAVDGVAVDDACSLESSTRSSISMLST